MTDTIKTQINNTLLNVTKEVLHQWIEGKDEILVTWNTFSQVLWKIEMFVVAI